MIEQSVHIYAVEMMISYYAIKKVNLHIYVMNLNMTIKIQGKISA
jgi:hypothetical protein